MFIIETHPLKHLLPSDILQPPVQILNLLHDILNLALIRTLDSARLSNGQIQGQLDAAHRMQGGEPARGSRIGCWREADLVIARVGSAECEAS